MAKKSNGGEAPGTVRDLFGIAIVTAGLILMVARFGDGGLLGGNVAAGLSWSLGWSGFLFPIGLMVIGLSYIISDDNAVVESTALGVVIILVAAAGLSHLSVPSSSYFEPAFLLSRGGLAGATLAFILSKLLGVTGAYLALTGGALAGLIFLTRTPIKEFVGRFSRERALPEAATKTSSARATRRLLTPVRTEERPILDDLETVELATPLLDNEEDTAGGIDSVQLTMELDRQAVTSGAYQLPPLSLLSRTPPRKASSPKRERSERIAVLEQTLRDFNIEATVAKIVEGPTVTRYELQIASGTKVNKIVNLADDMALALAATDVRVLAPIPGKSAVGIEVPNSLRNLVTLGDILSGEESAKNRSPLAIGIGKDITGQAVIGDLGQMPHLLIAGATGSGKSICINSILMSLLMRARPDQVRLVLVDPKRVELNLYNGIAHLLVPVVSKPKEAANALAWAVGEMERRYELLETARVRNIQAFNKALADGKYPDLESLPFIVVVIDELADLMMVAAGEVEDAICRLAQMARAVGIHLIVATQRPSADIITGLIKANITTRIAFAVSSGVDSRVILDQLGAEKLVGKGDMLYSTPDRPKALRVQGAFVTENEIELVTAFIKKQAEPHYQREILQEKRSEQSFDDFEDDLYEEARELVINTGQASTSALQRRLRVGYARAARLMDMLEQRGVVGPMDGSRPRAVLIRPEDMVDRS